MKRYLAVFVPLAVLCLAAPGYASAQSMAVRGGRIVTVSGETIDGGVIVIQDGKITAVGKDVQIPVEASVIDATTKVVMPGFIDVHNAAGLSQANEVNPNIPYISVVDGIDPIRDYFEDCRRYGITTAAVVPGNNTMIGGSAAIIKTAGSYVNDMILKRQGGVKISLRPYQSASRMSHYAKIRKELESARKFASGEDEQKTETATPATPPAETAPAAASGETPATPAAPTAAPPVVAAKSEAMQALIKGEIPAFMYCEISMDVLQAIKLAKEFSLKPILVLGPNCDEAAKAVADSGFPIILDASMVFWRTDPRTGKDEKIVLPKIFHEHNVSMLFQVDPAATSSMGANHLWYQAATAVKYGVPVEEAIKSVTLRAAQVLGVDKFVGSIEAGKDADLVVLSGDPLKVQTWVETTIVGGKVVYRRAEDFKLQNLLQPETK